MTKPDLSTEKILMVGLMKAFSEQSTFMIDAFKFQFKQDFNNLIKRVDEITNAIEGHLTEDQKEYLQSVTDLYHNINLEARNNLNKTYKELENDNSKLSSTVATNMAEN